jgi:HEAT repeat protein
MSNNRKGADAYLMEKETLPENTAYLLRVGIKSRAPTERERAILQLAIIENRQHKTVLTSLMPMTQDQDKFVRKAVVTALGILSPQGDGGTIATLQSMCDDREWIVRYAAFKAMVLVECGEKFVEGKKNSLWQPARKVIMDIITRFSFDSQPEIRCVAAEAVAMSIEEGDPEDLAFDVILTAGSNSMAIEAIEKVKGLSRTSSIVSVVKELGFGRKPSFGRAPSFSRADSTDSQRSSSKKWASAFERLKSNPDVKNADAYFSRLGAQLHMQGMGFLVRPANPPDALDADLQPVDKLHDDLQGKIAIFVLHPRRMTLAFIYDCAYRSQRQNAVGVVFCVKKPELMAAQRYDAQEMQKSFDEENTPAPKQLQIPVIFVSDLVKNLIEDGDVLLTIMPTTDILRGMLVDKKPAVKAAALRSLCAVAKRNDQRLMDVLVSMISDENEEVRRACLEAFMKPEKVWPGNPVVIEELAKVTCNENWLVREASLTALCKVANCDKETCDPDGVINNLIAIEAVIARLKDPEGPVKKLAIEGLLTLVLADGVIDEEDLPIIETFVENQSDGDPLVAAACAKALAFLSGEDNELTKVFAWMCDCRLEIRKSSVYALGKAQKKNNCVILSMLRRQILDEFGEVRATAAMSLVKVATRGNAGVIATIEPLLADHDPLVRSAALNALAVVMHPYEPKIMLSSEENHCRQGNLVKLLRIVDSVADVDTGVRISAEHALEKLANSSNEVAVRLAEILKSHEDFGVRKTALHSIHRILPTGDKGILEAIRVSLQDDRGEVRKLGFQLLKHHFMAGLDNGVDVNILKESVLESVKHDDPMVVLVTIEAIPALFDRGNRMAVLTLVRCLRHESSSVREASTRVLGEFGERGDLRAIGYITPLLDHHMAYVRYSSMIAIMNLGVPGDPKVLDLVQSKINDPEIFVRREAVTALQHLSVRGDEKSVTCLLSCMDNPDERIRIAAMTGLSVVARQGDPRAVAAYMKKIHIDTRPMRKLSVECFACLVKDDDYDNLELLMSSLEDTEHIVRQAGVQAVIKVVRKGDDEVIKRVMNTKFQHIDRKIRAVAMQVLQGISLPGDQRILSGMISSLKHPHTEVRKMAIEVICNVAQKGDDKVVGALAQVIADCDMVVRRAAVDAIKVLSVLDSPYCINQVALELASSEW